VEEELKESYRQRSPSRSSSSEAAIFVDGQNIHKIGCILRLTDKQAGCSDEVFLSREY
jgi:hypothetical protein